MPDIVLTADEWDGLFRLLAATAVGMLIGLNRDLHGKPTGIRTLGLVSLGAALVAIVAVRVEGMRENPDALSRVVQGIVQGVLTGIGFVGAGVVLRDRRNLSVHGLTTAATVWMTAALGIACALASWPFIAAGGAVTLALLLMAKPLDALIDTRSRSYRSDRPTHERDVATPPDGPQ